MIWILIVGLVAGIIARLLSPGPEQARRLHPDGRSRRSPARSWPPSSARPIGWYRADQGAGFIAATLGALLVLFIWNRLVASGTIGDPGAGPRV